MIPVLIVDDEFIVRVGMKSMIDWSTYGYEVVAEASTGKEGLALFQKYKPRLIFCDINMPDMSGLEMMEEIRKIDRDVVFVILTAYQEFSYAHKAIQLGAVEYVIKATMLPENIVALLKRLYNQLSPDDAAEEDRRDQRRREKELLFAALQNGDLEVGALQLERRFPGAKFYDLLYARTPSGFKDAMDSQFKDTVSAIFRDVMRRRGLNATVLNQGSAYWILTADADRWSLYNAIQRSLSGVLNYLPTGLRIGVAENLSAQILLLHGIEWAQYAYESHALYDEGFGYIVYDPGYNDSAEAKSTVAQAVQRVGNCLLKLNFQEAKKATDALFARVVAPTGSLEVLHVALVGMLRVLAQYLPIDEKKELIQLNHLENRKDILEQLFRHIDEIEQKADGMTPAKLHVENAKEYIRKHYMQQISLKDVAVYLSLSQNYLSKIFYRETGRHITDYITDIKIAHACELLKTTADPVSLIADNLGFGDQAYFAKRFKSNMGLSPNAYRKKYGRTQT